MPTRRAENPSAQRIMETFMRSLVILLTLCLAGLLNRAGLAEPLRAGIARVDITDRQARKVNDPCYAKAL